MKFSPEDQVFLDEIDATLAADARGDLLNREVALRRLRKRIANRKAVAVAEIDRLEARNRELEEQYPGIGDAS